MLFILALLLQADAPGPPEVWYRQAMGCAASFAASVAPGATPDAETAKEMFLWGMIVADAAPKAGRTAEQVDGPDSEESLAFFRRLRAEKPRAHKAHLAYCGALTRKR